MKFESNLQPWFDLGPPVRTAHTNKARRSAPRAHKQGHPAKISAAQRDRRTLIVLDVV